MRRALSEAIGFVGEDGGAGGDCTGGSCAGGGVIATAGGDNTLLPQNAATSEASSKRRLTTIYPDSHTPRAHDNAPITVTTNSYIDPAFPFFPSFAPAPRAEIAIAACPAK